MRGSAEELERVREQTQEGAFDLDRGERKWRDKSDLLLQHGYRLRPRFLPGWDSLLGGQLTCYRSIARTVYGLLCVHNLSAKYFFSKHVFKRVVVMDAIRVSDEKRVMIKRTRRESRTEGEVARFLSSPSLGADPANHCVPSSRYRSTTRGRAGGFHRHATLARV